MSSRLILVCANLHCALPAPAADFGLNEEVIVDALMDLRQSLRPMAEARGLKFTYMPLLLKAASLALSAHPELNALISPDASDVILSE